MRGASAGDSTPMPLTRRLREEDFTSNLCWLLVCSRTSFPPPVTRTRLAVPLWVFCFGMSLVLFVCCHKSVGPPAGSRRELARGGGQEGPYSGAGRLLLGRACLLRLGGTAGRVGRCLVLVRGDHHDHVPAVLLRVGLDDAQFGD